VPLSEEIAHALKKLSEGGAGEVRENGGRFASLASLSWELRGQDHAPLIHLWSGEHNLTRRVLAVTHHSDESLVLAVQRFGRTKPDRLEFSRVDLEHPQRQLSREGFRAWLARLLALRFPDETVESLSVAADLEHSISGCYVRGVMRGMGRVWAILAVSKDEDAAAQENILTFGLLWLDRTRQSAKRQHVAGLRLFLPEGLGSGTCQRLAALDASTTIEVYEIRPTLEEVVQLDPHDAGNLATWLVPRRETESLLAQARSASAPVIKLAPESISLSAVPGTREVVLRFRGFAFAHWTEGRVFFGVGESREELTPANEPALLSLVRELMIYRHPLASDTHHPYYRAQPERWLETMVREDPARIDPRLDAETLYTQVPAVAAGDRGVMDMLGVTREGRLAIIELKADEHLHLPLQAADYWLRVCWHQQRGDLHRYGYFTGAELQSKSPLVYLVAPGLRFHPSTDTLLRFLSPDMEVIRVGLAEDWRKGLRVILRQ
jgi:hypothetical protein